MKLSLLIAVWLPLLGTASAEQTGTGSLVKAPSVASIISTLSDVQRFTRVRNSLIAGLRDPPNDDFNNVAEEMLSEVISRNVRNFDERIRCRFNYDK